MVGTLSATSAIGTTTYPPLAGAGSLSGVLKPVLSAAGALGGSGTLSGAATVRYLDTGALTGAGTLAGGIGNIIYPNEAGPLTGAGTLSGSAVAQYLDNGPLTGAGALSASAVAPVAFVAGASKIATGNQSTISVTLNTTGVNFLVVAVGAESGSNTSAVTGTCTCAGTAMTSAAKQTNGSGLNFYYHQMFILASPPQGTAQTITFTASASIGTLFISAQGYSGVNSYGTPVTNSATTGTAWTSTAVASAANHMVAQSFASASITTTQSAYSGTARYAPSGYGFVAGDAAGAGSVSFTATGSQNDYWSSLAVDLSY